MSMFWLMVVLSAWVVSAVILLSAPCVVKILRHCGLIGVILVMLSVQPLLLRDLIRGDTCRDRGPLQSFMMLIKSKYKLHD